MFIICGHKKINMSVSLSDMIFVIYLVCIHYRFDENQYVNYLRAKEKKYVCLSVCLDDICSTRVCVLQI